MELEDFKAKNTRELTEEEKLDFLKVVKQAVVDLRIKCAIDLKSMDDGMYLAHIKPTEKKKSVCLLISCHVGEQNGKDAEQYSIMGWVDGEIKFGNSRDDYMLDTDISEFYLKIMYYINNVLK